MHYGNCNAEPTIIRRILGENQNCSGDEVELFPVRDFSKELVSKFEGCRPAFLPNSLNNYEVLQRFY